MLTKCANPECLEEFHSLRHGRLFVLDAQPLQPTEKGARCISRQRESLEYFWLCETCCKSMRVGVDRLHRVLVMSLENPDARPLEVLPLVHPPAERASTRSSGRRVRHPSDSWREGAGVRKI